MKKILVLVLFFVELFYFNTTLFAQQNTILIKSERNKDNSIDFFYEKSVPGSYTILVEFTNLINSYNTNFEVVVNSSSGKLFKLNPIDKNKGISFISSHATYVNGKINPKADSLFVYTLPFQKGKIISVYESNNLYHDIFNAELPKNWKAYQFKATTADTIFAARKGIVTHIVDHFQTDTISLYTSKKNYITVEHTDGTFATYTGFAYKKVLARLGETVYPQLPIGIIKESFKPAPNDFSMMVYYKEKEKSKKNSKDSNNKLRLTQTFITPYFLTDKGVIQLEHFEKYNVAIDKEILQKELSKSEKKKMNHLN